MSLSAAIAAGFVALNFGWYVIGSVRASQPPSRSGQQTGKCLLPKAADADTAAALEAEEATSDDEVGCASRLFLLLRLHRRQALGTLSNRRQRMLLSSAMLAVHVVECGANVKILILGWCRQIKMTRRSSQHLLVRNQPAR